MNSSIESVVIRRSKVYSLNQLSLVSGQQELIDREDSLDISFQQDKKLIYLKLNLIFVKYYTSVNNI